MIGDLVIARPLLIGATCWAPPLSSSACRSPRWAAMSVRRAGALVVEPGKAAFVRCLGCTTSGYNAQN